MVVVDRFTKYGHFMAITLPFIASSVAKLFLDNIYKLHRMPQSIISGRDKIFTNKFYLELFHLLGTKLHFRFAYHLQTNGQIERVNQCLEMYLRYRVYHHPKQWEK